MGWPPRSTVRRRYGCILGRRLVSLVLHFGEQYCTWLVGQTALLRRHLHLLGHGVHCRRPKVAALGQAADCQGLSAARARRNLLLLEAESTSRHSRPLVLAMEKIAAENDASRQHRKAMSSQVKPPTNPTRRTRCFQLEGPAQLAVYALNNFHIHAMLLR